MSAFNLFMDEILLVEGGYSDNPADSGGKTKYGITESVARRYGYVGQMIDMNLNFAYYVYRLEYWKKLYLEEISTVSIPIALKLGDIGVNMGNYRAGEFLQRLLNVLNRNELDYADITVDGAIGPKTLAALTAFLKKRKENGEIVILRGLNALQGSFYITLAERRSKDETFVYGWLLQRLQ